MGVALSSDGGNKESDGSNSGLSPHELACLRETLSNGAYNGHDPHAKELCDVLFSFLTNTAPSQTGWSAHPQRLRAVPHDAARRTSGLLYSMPMDLLDLAHFLEKHQRPPVHTMDALVSLVTAVGLDRICRNTPIEASTDVHGQRQRLIDLLTTKPVKDSLHFSAADLDLNADAQHGAQRKQSRFEKLVELPDWITHSTHARILWTESVRSALFGSLQSAYPQSQPYRHPSILLSLESWFMLDAAIQERGFTTREWKPIFTTKSHGRSWAAFEKSVTEPESTVVIVRDRHAHVFGGFATTMWKPQPSFYGSPQSFVFGLFPTMNVFHSTSLNTNYQYFNFGKQSLPNGMGFGGQLEYFGLFIDASFERGHSRAEPISTTFGNPQLSEMAEFDIDYVEVWCIKSPEIDDRFIDPKSKKSVLDNHEGAAFLEMAGKTMYSKQLGEPDPKEESQDE